MYSHVLRPWSKLLYMMFRTVSQNEISAKTSMESGTSLKFRPTVRAVRSMSVSWLKKFE